MLEGGPEGVIDLLGFSTVFLLPCLFTNKLVT